MSAREPLSAAQLESIERLLARVTPGHWVVRLQSGADPQVAIADGGPVAFGVRAPGDAAFIAGAPEVVRLLVAEVGWLVAELTNARALLAKTIDNMTALAEGSEVTAYRAEHGEIPLGTYLAVEEARAHAEDSYRALIGPAPTLHWYDEELDDDSALRLYAEHEGDEVETTHRVVPVRVLAEYDPDGES
ncbi:hypothetical protein P3T35_003123 [Kitasatospora sp. GP30]|uniref:hypothetical protein n=1 Tax=Kitasatospora sp. GP30 TaxID=3035084 RepID=UPI000C707CFD|nr:hypothetical protein [Kitasatospora sp. GP30]MDH6141110.1 hypothetical protein [Kitasatospora sp. GP30]